MAGAYLTALALRFDGRILAPYWDNLLVFLAFAVPTHLTLLAARGMYGRVWHQAGVQEARDLITATGFASVLLVTVALVFPTGRLLPLSVAVFGSVLFLFGAGAVRFTGRLSAARRQAARRGGRGDATDPTPVVVMGGTESARTVIAQMHGDPDQRFRPVAVLTDEMSAWGRRLLGVPVLGPVTLLRLVSERYGAQQALLAYANPSGRQVRKALAYAREAEVQLKVLPTVAEVVDRRPTIRDVRDLSINDLLGRQQVSIDDHAVRSVITGKKVLVTGAGGSIGSEIAAQVAALGPARLVILDHDETHLHDVTLSLKGAVEPYLADIRDETAIRRVFSRYSPDVVFHAAAHKHVPILEEFPSEAARTNVFGTEVLLRAAAMHGTPYFVSISTDKAVNPSSVMGASKRVAEQLLLHYRPQGAAWCAVRFGNVLGSRGSVIPTFLRQIEEGGPVTVTDPEVTRFFMSIPEAVQLVLQASTLATGGEIFMLDMGEPVRILELAERVIQFAGATPGVDVKIKFTGLRPGEKLAEQLCADFECEEATRHDKIRVVRTQLIEALELSKGLEELRGLAERRDERAVAATLFGLVGKPQGVAIGAAG